jgi:hypothetical protein
MSETPDPATVAKELREYADDFEFLGQRARLVNLMREAAALLERYVCKTNLRTDLSKP